MSDRPVSGGLLGDDGQAERWLATLRDGSPDEKAAARRGLAGHFEARGMVAEATDLLVANAREGYRDVELFQALARLYRAQGEEYLSASAALEATRLSGQRQDGMGTGRSETVRPGSSSRHAPWGQADQRRPEDAGPEGRREVPRGVPAPEAAAAPAGGAVWRRPARIVGWLAVVITLLAALGVASTSVASAAVYIASAAVLVVLVSGSPAARRAVRLPGGPLGDGTLVFSWLLLLLVAGAILPRGPGFVGAFSSQPSATPTTPLYRTPSPSAVP